MANPFEDAYGKIAEAPVAVPKKDFLGVAGDVIAGTASAIGTGAAKAVDETLDTASQLGAMAAGSAKAALPQDWQDGITNTFAPAANALRKYGVVNEDHGFGPNITDAMKTAGIETPDAPQYKLVEGAAEFATGFIGAGRVLKAVKPITKVGVLAKGAVQGAIADFSAFDPHQERLSNLVENFPILKNPVTAFLAAKDGDSAIEGRLKQTLEGLGVGGLTEAVIWGVKGARYALRGDKAGVEAAHTAAEASLKKAGADAQTAHEAQLALPAPDAAAAEAAAKEGVPAGVPATVAKGEPKVPANVSAEAEPKAGSAAAEGGTGARQGTPTEDTIWANQKNTAAVIEEMRVRKAGEQIGGAGHPAGEYNPASDINWSKVGDEQGVKLAIQAVSKVFEHEHAATGGAAQTIKDIREAGADVANDLSISKDALMENVARMSDDASKLPTNMAAMRAIHASTADNFTAALEAAMHNPTDETMGTMVRSLETFSRVQASLKGMSSNAARTLRYLREHVGIDTDLRLKLAQIEDPRIVNMFDPTGKSTNAADALNSMMGRAAKVPKGAAGRKALVQVMEPSFFKRVTGKVAKVTEHYYTASILSNMGTHAVNVAGGLMNNIIIPGERAIAGAAIGDREVMREGIDQLVATWTALPDAFAQAGKAIKRNQSILAPMNQGGLAGGGGRGISAVEMGARPDSLTGVFLNALDTVTSGSYRMIAGGDELNRQMAFRGSVKAQALRSGRALKLAGKDLADYVDTRLTEAVKQDGSAYTTADIVGLQRQREIAVRDKDAMLVNEIDTKIADATASSRGLDTSTEAVFGENLPRGSFSYNLEKTIRSIPLSRVLVAPFIRTPTNIVKWGIKRTPGISRLMEDVRHDLSGANGKEAQGMANARLVTGTGLYMTGLGLAASGTITGAGPSDPKKLAALKQTGWKQFAVKLGDEFHTINRFDPVALPMSIAATAYERFQEGDEQLSFDIAGHSVSAFVAALKDKTYLQGVSDMIDLFDTKVDDEKKSDNMQRFLAAKAGGFTPAIITNNIRGDDVNREAHGFMEQLATREPFGASQGLDSARNLLGEERLRDSPWPNSLFGVSVTSHADDALMNELTRLTIGTGSASEKPSKTQKGVDLSAMRSPVTGKSAYDRFQELTATAPDPKTGLTLRQQLEAHINSPAYKMGLSDGYEGEPGTRLALIRKTMTDHRATALKLLTAETPELAIALGQAKLQKGALKVKGTDPLTPEDQPGANYSALLKTFRQ